MLQNVDAAVAQLRDRYVIAFCREVLPRDSSFAGFSLSLSAEKKGQRLAFAM